MYLVSVDLMHSNYTDIIMYMVLSNSILINLHYRVSITDNYISETYTY